MPQRRLSSDEANCIMNVKKMGLSNVEIAKRLGVTEGAIRYRLKRERSGMKDRRKERNSGLEPFYEVIRIWLDDYDGEGSRPVIKAMRDMLLRIHGYKGSYSTINRFVRKRFPDKFKGGKKIRLETPPGQLLQVDWKEKIKVQMGEPGHWLKLNAACFTMGFSRKMKVFFSQRKDQESFIHFHREAFRRFGGLAKTIRMDCLKSAVQRWNGQQSELTNEYRRFLDSLGVNAFPSRPGKPTDKGKIEKRIRDLFGRLDLRHRLFLNMEDLQNQVEEELTKLEQEWRCGATGLGIEESFKYEKQYLRPLPEVFPQLPLHESHLRVQRDGLVYYAGNSYQIHHAFVGKDVLCQNTGKEILIYCDGLELGRFPYLPETKGMVRLSEAAISDPGVHISDTVKAWGLEVARRQLDIYEAIIARRKQHAS